VDFVRKIISMQHQNKYTSIITILHNMEDLSKLTIRLANGKLVAYKMSQKMGQKEVTSSSKCIILTCEEKKKKMKDKK
jgi:ABC-type multidrug transport system ATPase subunit